VKPIRRDGIPLVLDRLNSATKPVQAIAEVLLQALYESEPHTMTFELRLGRTDNREVVSLFEAGGPEVVVA